MSWNYSDVNAVAMALVSNFPIDQISQFGGK